jgi:hypothetical protein
MDAHHTGRESAEIIIFKYYIMRAVLRQGLSSGCKSRPANWVAPAGSYRSGGGGNEAVGAFETQVPPWRCREPSGRNASECRAGLERFNVGADPPLYRGRPSSLASRETGGIGRPMSDPTQRSHRGKGNGMRAHGRPLQHGKPRSTEARDLQPDAREGQAGSGAGVTDRPVVPRKPGNAGGGKGPEFKTSVRRGTRTRRLA